MTAMISSEQTILELAKTLNPQQQQQVIDFIEFLHFQSQKQEKIVEQLEDKEPISFLEAAKEFIGCIDSGISDLSLKKKELKKGYKALCQNQF
jgi:hypothetical protein